jgi:hypothetical protein
MVVDGDGEVVNGSMSMKESYQVDFGATQESVIRWQKI